MTHDGEITEINGKKKDIDKEMIPLIQELNRLGLKTTNCCQGDKNHNAYVSIQLDEKSRFCYYIEKNVLSIRWDRGGIDHMPTEPFIIAENEVIRVSEIKRKTNPKTLTDEQIIQAYLEAERQNSKSEYIAMDELYLRINGKMKITTDDFKSSMIRFFDTHSANEYEFAFGSCIRTEIKKYGFPAGGNWRFYMKKIPAQR